MQLPEFLSPKAGEGEKSQAPQLLPSPDLVKASPGVSLIAGAVRMCPAGKVSVLDVLKLKGFPAPSVTLSRLLKAHPSFRDLLYYFQFPGERQRPTPVIAPEDIPQLYDLLRPAPRSWELDAETVGALRTLRRKGVGLRPILEALEASGMRPKGPGGKLGYLARALVGEGEE